MLKLPDQRGCGCVISVGSFVLGSQYRIRCFSLHVPVRTADHHLRMFKSPRVIGLPKVHHHLHPFNEYENGHQMEWAQVHSGPNGP